MIFTVCPALTILGSVLQAVDDALKSAADAKKKASDGADEAFKSAVSMLKDYGRTHCPGEAVEKKMKEAEEEDKSSMKVLNRLKETFRVRDVLTSLLCRILTLIFSRSRRNRRRKSTFFSTTLFLIRIPPL
jgi:hypothetical protein